MITSTMFLVKKKKLRCKLDLNALNDLKYIRKIFFTPTYVIVNVYSFVRVH